MISRTATKYASNRTYNAANEKKQKTNITALYTGFRFNTTNNAEVYVYAGDNYFVVEWSEMNTNFNNSIEIIKNENNQKINNYSKKTIILSAEEFKKHKEFLKKDFKRNFF